jgi:hypothetical protein
VRNRRGSNLENGSNSSSRSLCFNTQGFITYTMNNIWIVELDVMDHQQNGENLDYSYLNETITPATTVELLQLIQSITSHPSSKGGDR